MVRQTIDPDVVIEAEGAGWVVYRNTREGKRWMVKGVCNQCGICEVGDVTPGRMLKWAEGKKVGEPGACIDLDYGRRPDIPLMPALKEDSRKMAKELGVTGECCLEFEWLE